MGYICVCLMLVLCVSKVSGQYMNFLQDYRSQQKYMDEGFEYVRESPHAFNQLSQRYFPQQQHYPPSRQQGRSNKLSNKFNLFGGLGFNSFGGMGSSQGYNSFGGGGLATNKGFLDEGFEHIRERGTAGNMQSIMSNPSLFLSALFA